MVKDEVDIIERTIRHMITQGVDYVLVSDNGSTDGTLKVLNRLALELPVFVAKDPIPAFNQGEKMTFLANAARRRGARWVVAFDADEFWYAEGVSIGEFLRGTNRKVVSAQIHNTYPEPNSAGGWLDATAERLTKVAFRTARGAQIRDGNHSVDRSGNIGTGLHLMHFPWRSPEHLTRKGRQGAFALGLGNVSQRDGGHWRHVAQADDALLAELWASIAQRLPHPLLDMVCAGPFKFVVPEEEEVWPLQPPKSGLEVSGI